MYNEEWKMKFIDGFTQSKSRKEVARGFFKALEPYEKEWGADVCTRSKEEIEAVMDSMVGALTRSSTVRVYILREYMDWCVANGFPGARSLEIEPENLGIGKFASQYVSGPSHLQHILDAMFVRESCETRDNILRCMYWLAFAGMDEKYFNLVRITDVDLNSMNVNFRLPGKDYSTVYPIYREAVPAFRNCIALPYFIRNGTNVKTGRQPNGLLLRTATGTYTLNSLRSYITECNNKLKESVKEGRVDSSLNYALTFRRIWVSGMCYRMYEDERQGYEPDDLLQRMVSQYMRDNPPKGDKTHRQMIVSAASLKRDFRNNYLRWKSVYSR